jgi:hypothetical protein
MNPADIFKFLPYAGRLAAAAQTIERLEKDPGVQDLIKLMEEIGTMVAQSQKPEQHG